MTEGTRLGQFEEDYSFGPSTELNENDAIETKATKIGEMNDFEKNFFSESGSAEPQVDEKNVIAEPAEIQIDPIIDSPKEETPKRVQEEITEEKKPQDDSSYFEAQLEKTVVDYANGDIIKGVIRKVEKSGLLVDINYKSDGFVANSELSNSDLISLSNFSEGDEIDVYITQIETKEGYTILSRKRAEYELAWNDLVNIIKDRDQIEVDVTSNVGGGLVAEYNGIKGFVPASHVLQSTNDNLENYINQKLTVIVLQADRKRRKVIFSYKLAKTKPQKTDVTKIIDTLEVGEVKKGTVSSIKDFGAFIDIGGIEGLVHISEMSWARVNHPSELININDQVEVFILGIDKETNKVSLGMKQLQPDPWVNVAARYSIGQIVTGKISRVVTFGAFMQIEKDLEGLIHISELAYNHIDKVEDIVKIGQEIQAKIIKLIPDEQRIGLSLKGLNGSSDTEETESADNDKKPETEESVEPVNVI